MKKTVLIVAGVLLALGIVVTTAAALSLKGDFNGFSGEKEKTNTYVITEAVKKIKVNLSTADFTIKPSENGEIKVVCVEDEKVKHTVSADGDTLNIGITDTRKWYDKITFFSMTKSITLYLPEGRYEALSATSDTGDISVPENFTFGSADIKLTTGDVDFRAETEGELKIKVSTGGCNLTNVKCGSFISSGSTGDLVLKNVIADKSFDIKRSTGDILFEKSDAAEIKIKTSTGDVTGSLTGDKVFLTETSTGTVSVPKSVTGGKCEISTSTGDIMIRVEK